MRFLEEIKLNVKIFFLVVEHHCQIDINITTYGDNKWI
jgi:hypothetical protein